jgi:hypothetical protein
MSAMVNLRADAPESAIRPPESWYVVAGPFKVILATRHCTGIAQITPAVFVIESWNWISADA